MHQNLMFAYSSQGHQMGIGQPGEGPRSAYRNFLAALKLYRISHAVSWSATRAALPGVTKTTGSSRRRVVDNTVAGKEAHTVNMLVISQGLHQPFLSI